jgi:hypothetical protein
VCIKGHTPTNISILSYLDILYYRGLKYQLLVESYTLGSFLETAVMNRDSTKESTAEKYRTFVTAQQYPAAYNTMCRPVCNSTSVDCSTLFNDGARDLSNTFSPQSNYLEYHPESWWDNPIPPPCSSAPYEWFSDWWTDPWLPFHLDLGTTFPPGSDTFLPLQHFHPPSTTEADGGEILAGIGLYDTSEACQISEPSGMGLKLEEAWDPLRSNRFDNS